MDAPFVIDPATGRIRFPDLNLELRPLMPQEEFVAATSSLNRDNLGVHGNSERYSIRQEIPGDRILGMYFVFVNGRLTKASFAYCPKDETWDNWSEEGEKARFKEYQQLLAEQLGGKDSFPWGKTRVWTDSKSGGTDIWVDYPE